MGSYRPALFLFSMKTTDPKPEDLPELRRIFHRHRESDREFLRHPLLSSDARFYDN